VSLGAALFDLGLGTDNLRRRDKAKLRVRFSIINLTNKDACTTSSQYSAAPISWRLEHTNCSSILALTHASIGRDAALETP
jgi:hypothetical protein